IIGSPRHRAEMEPLDCVRIVSSFAKLNINNEGVFEVLAFKIVNEPGFLQKFQPRDISQTLLAFTHLQINNKPMFLALKKRILGAFDLEKSIQPSDLVLILWCFAKSATICSDFADAAILMMERDPN